MRTREEKAAHRARMDELDRQDQAATMPPRFTETCKDNDGKCVNCNGRQFAPFEANVFGGRAWAAERGKDVIRCFTCGAEYTRG